MKKRYPKLFPLILSVALCFLAVSAIASDTDLQQTRRIERMERYIYGVAQEGAIAQRLDNIEKDLLGRNSAGKIPEKADTLFRFLFRGEDSSPSLDMKLNLLEWKIFHETRTGKLSDRIAALDTFISGKSSGEPLAFRIEQLIQMSMDDPQVSLKKVHVPIHTGIRLLISQDISSKSAKEGDEIPMTVAADVFLGKNVLFIGKGSPVSGEIDKVRRGSRFGRSGYVKLMVNSIPCIDSTQIPVAVGDPVKGELNKKQVGMAIGASALGYFAIGPVGLVGGAFVKGKDTVIPEGTEVFVTTIEDVNAYGIVVDKR